MLNLDRIISAPKSAQLLEQLLQPKKAVSAVIGLGYVGLQELAEVTKNGLLDSTTDFSRLSDADVVVICVPTPLTNQREPDLSFLRATAAVIANSL